MFSALAVANAAVAAITELPWVSVRARGQRSCRAEPGVITRRRLLSVGRPKVLKLVPACSSPRCAFATEALQRYRLVPSVFVSAVFSALVCLLWARSASLCGHGGFALWASADI